jgi:hypothetical protein
MSEKMLAMCGLDCSVCRAYIATKENDWTKLAETAKLWSQPGEEFKPEDILCDGCHTERLHEFCRRCEARVCAKSLQYGNCGDCPQYFCRKLTALWKSFATVSGEKAKANLDKYKENLSHDKVS